MDTKKIGAFLKQCRKEKNLTQEQLAEVLGVSAITQRCQPLCKKEGRKGFYLLCALMFFGFSLTVE